MTTDTVGGVFTYSAALARGLGGAGVTVTLACMGRRAAPEQCAELTRAGARVMDSDYRLEWMDDPWEDVARAGDWLLGIERRTRPDIVHVNGYAHAALPWRAPSVLVAHSCVCSWWRAVLNEPAPERYAQYRTEVRRGLDAADVVIAPSAAMLAALEREYGAVARARVIHNGSVPAAASSAGKEPFIFSAGRVWDRAKNIAQLERAAQRVPWPIIVAGDTSNPDGHETSALPHLELLGALPHGEVTRWMQRASIFALPAHYEPFGLAALEAALAGCALVLGDIPSFRELWGDAASYVAPDDAEALAAALTELTGDAELRRTRAATARRRAERYDAAAMCQSYLELYRSLTEPRRGVSPARALEVTS